VREVIESQAWFKLERERNEFFSLPQSVTLDANTQITLRKRCHILAGLNGSGKSETLRKLSNALGRNCTIVRLHETCEQVRAILRSRDDIGEMEAEVGSLPISSDMIASLKRVIGRDYESVGWYNLELEPTQPTAVKWPWPEDVQSIVPHFLVEHDGVNYRSTEMGLGEFSVHLLFWILWQFRERPGTVFLLDEPDAYLPPRTRMRFLSWILTMAREYKWQLVISSHAEQIINVAHDNDALVVLARHSGSVNWYHSSEHAENLIRDLVAQAPAELILFCEDEVAAAMTRAMIVSGAPELSQSSVVIWKDGDGYLRSLAKHLPRTTASPVQFALVFDGDQRNKIEAFAEGNGWPVLCLPTSQSPDALLRGAKSSPSTLAEALGRSEPPVVMALSALEGVDDHDWVNEIADRFGPRTHALDTLAQLWVKSNELSATAFCDQLKRNFSGRVAKGKS
jgi:AAA domain, putative AbiEii toxin, Type IV TA system